MPRGQVMRETETYKLKCGAKALSALRMDYPSGFLSRQQGAITPREWLRSFLENSDVRDSLKILK
jgi:hypothetical protein